MLVMIVQLTVVLKITSQMLTLHHYPHVLSNVCLAKDLCPVSANELQHDRLMGSLAMCTPLLYATSVVS